MILLFCLTLGLSFIVFQAPGANGESGSAGAGLSFGLALELSVVMPLSWLPLISDYTRHASSRRGGFWGSMAGYFIGSSWMYMIGLGAAIYTGSSDPSAILLAADLGLAAIGIVTLSTVTTTFLDAYSAGVSFLNIRSKANEKIAALVMAVLGTCIAIIIPIEQYENFLYAIGSVFAPLFAILLTDYFILKKKDIDDQKIFDWLNTIIWAFGAVTYQIFTAMEFIGGSTLPVILITVLLCMLKGVIKKWISLKNA